MLYNRPQNGFGTCVCPEQKFGSCVICGLLTPGEGADLVLQAGVYCYGSPGSTNQLQTAAMINPYVLEM